MTWSLLNIILIKPCHEYATTAYFALYLIWIFFEVTIKTSIGHGDHVQYWPWSLWPWSFLTTVLHCMQNMQHCMWSSKICNNSKIFCLITVVHTFISEHASRVNGLFQLCKNTFNIRYNFLRLLGVLEILLRFYCIPWKYQSIRKTNFFQFIFKPLS